MNSHQCYTLHQASRSGHDTCIKNLLARGASIETKGFDCDGSTPLILASKYGHIECVRILLDAGANFHQTNYNGKTPTDMATDEIKVFLKTWYHNKWLQYEIPIKEPNYY
jgi:ankyrin repeat protein